LSITKPNLVRQAKSKDGRFGHLWYAAVNLENELAVVGDVSARSLTGGSRKGQPRAMQAVSRKMLTSLACGVLILGSSSCGTARRGERAQAPAVATPSHQTTPGKAVAEGAPPGQSTTSTAATPVGLPAGVVVRVGHHSITRRMLEHWIGVQALVKYQPRPTRPVPRGLIPTPPDYRACIAYLAPGATATSTRPAPSTAQLRTQCEQEYASLLKQTQGKLILNFWVREEAARAGAAMTARETDRALHFQFPSEDELHRYLAFTRLRLSDERFLLEEDLQPDKWHRAVLPVYARLRHSKPPESEQMVGEVDAELGALSVRLSKRWIPKTHCSPGYVLAMCSEYRR
jgi:hypothetical protein